MVTSGQANKSNSGAEFSEADFEALKSGSQEALGKAFATYCPFVVYVAKKTGASSADADEIAQECFVKLWKRASSIRHAKALKSWLAITCRNLMIDVLRKRKLKPSAKVDVETLSTEGVGDVEDLHRRETELSIVRRYIDEVTSDTGDDSFYLFYVEGKSATAIAKTKGEAVSTVTTRISRLRKKIREALLRSLSDL